MNEPFFTLPPPSKWQCVKCLILDLTPRWMRKRWPLKRYFWQIEEIEEWVNQVKQLEALLNWEDDNVQ